MGSAMLERFWVRGQINRNTWGSGNELLSDPYKKYHTETRHPFQDGKQKSVGALFVTDHEQAR